MTLIPVSTKDFGDWTTKRDWAAFASAFDFVWKLGKVGFCP
jgi:hypothetical protein